MAQAQAGGTIAELLRYSFVLTSTQRGKAVRLLAGHEGKSLPEMVSATKAAAQTLAKAFPTVADLSTLEPGDCASSPDMLRAWATVVDGSMRIQAARKRGQRRVWVQQTKLEDTTTLSNLARQITSDIRAGPGGYISRPELLGGRRVVGAVDVPAHLADAQIEISLSELHVKAEDGIKENSTASQSVRMPIKDFVAFRQTYLDQAVKTAEDVHASQLAQVRKAQRSTLEAIAGTSKGTDKELLAAVIDRLSRFDVQGPGSSTDWISAASTGTVDLAKLNTAKQHIERTYQIKLPNPKAGVKPSAYVQQLLSSLPKVGEVVGDPPLEGGKYKYRAIDVSSMGDWFADAVKDKSGKTYLEARRSAHKKHISSIAAVTAELSRALAPSDRIGVSKLQSLISLNDTTTKDKLGVEAFKNSFEPGQPMHVLASLLHKDVASRAEVYIGESARAYCTPDNNIAMPAGDRFIPSTLAHEYGHSIEHNSRAGALGALALIRERSRGQPERALQDIFPNSSYHADERTYEDSWQSPYTGKWYQTDSTEVLSMGIEALVANPVKFLRTDPDHALHTLAVITGQDGERTRDRYVPGSLARRRGFAV